MKRASGIQLISPHQIHSSGIWPRTLLILTLAIAFLFASLVASPKEKARGRIRRTSLQGLQDRPMRTVGQSILSPDEWGRIAVQ